MVTMVNERDVLWGLYQDHTGQARHHEEQRTAATNLIIAVSGAVLGLVALDDQVNSADVPLALFLVAVGAFGALLSAKHHERFWFHTERARGYRDALQTRLEGVNIRELKGAADDRSRRNHPLLSRIPLFSLWVAFHLAVVFIGVVLAWLALTSQSA